MLSVKLRILYNSEIFTTRRCVFDVFPSDTGLDPQTDVCIVSPEVSGVTEEILEKVEVVCWFRGGAVLPCRFRWNGRVYRIARVSSSWESREGEHRNLHYTVSTMSGDAYEIHLDTGSMTWQLDYGYGST